jgi:hypothetical protein
VPLFRRSTTAQVAETEPGPPAKPAGKGRPTPKRQDARRRTTAAPESRRDAYRLRREKIRAERRTMRSALLTGDERNLPPRDAGPAKRYARDVVDGRRSAAGLFLPLAVLLLAATAVRNTSVYSIVQYAYLVLFLAIIADSIVLSRRLKREVTDRFGAAATRGISMYALMRSAQIRRFRVPPPKVNRGEPPRP